MTSPSPRPYGGGTKQRSQVAMSPEEIDAFIAEKHTLSIATVNRDGSIHMVAMWYGFLEGCVAIESKAKAQKVLNLRRNPHCTVMVEDGQKYEELRGVTFVGKGEIVDDPDRMFTLGISVFERYMGASYTEAMKPAVEAMLHKRVVVKLNVDKVVSWDHRKLGLGTR
jgi:PPOX class probable F420-dependent enzyme